MLYLLISFSSQRSVFHATKLLCTCLLPKSLIQFDPRRYESMFPITDTAPPSTINILHQYYGSYHIPLQSPHSDFLIRMRNARLLPHLTLAFKETKLCQHLPTNLSFPRWFFDKKNCSSCPQSLPNWSVVIIQ